MTENDHLETGQEQEEDFAKMFAKYEAELEDDLQVGDLVRGEIISIGSDSVFINAGAKIDGAADRSELEDENGEIPYQVGDVVELYVVSKNESELRLSKAISGIGGLKMLEQAFHSQTPVEGKITSVNKGGFDVEVLQRRTFCPVSQVDIEYVENAEEFVGKVFHFLITKFEENGRNVVLSRRKILEKEREQARSEFLEKTEIGSVVDGRVTRLTSFGAFVEIAPGVEGLVHISELSWSRIEKPGDAVQPGENIKVKLLRVEEGQKKGEVKMSLSLREALGDPWEKEIYDYKAGSKVQGRVTRLAPFGAFVEIAPGLEGLVHISEMSYAKRVHRAEDVVSQGETVDVMIKEIDPEKRRISLSIRDAEGDPWVNIGDRYPVGKTVQGVVEKKEAFGTFINLEPGITGLLPRSKMGGAQKAAEIDRAKPGDTISIAVLEVQPNSRKITLGAEGGKAGGAGANEAGDWKKYARSSGGSLGALGEKLQEAMNRKK